MNAFFPLLAAVLQAGSQTLDKVILSVRRMDYRAYVGASFPICFAVTAIVFFAFHIPISYDLFTGRLLTLLLFSIVLSIAGNLIFYRALQSDRLSEIQTIDLLHRLPLILLAGALFAEERNPIILLAALAASLAIVWSHWEHHSFRIHRLTGFFLAWTLIAAPCSAIISKMLLVAWHPVALELVRTGGMALILTPLYFKRERFISSKAWGLLLATNALTAISFIFYYLSVQRSGLIYTTLLFALQPLLVYFAAVLLLGERPSRKKFVGFFVVLASIVVAQVLS